jgi:hypothetical protein
MNTDNNEIISIGSPCHRKDKARCKRCGLIMKDCEPFAPDGEWWHWRSKEPCVNDNKYLTESSGEIEYWSPKKYRRAVARGARRASKFRPNK